MLKVVLAYMIYLLTLHSLHSQAQTASMQRSKQYQEAAGTEEIDLNMYSRIREEGFRHSRIMEFAGVLADDIGPRLTGSSALNRAQEWTRAQLSAMGCSDTHLEGWGEFGMNWTQLSTTVDLVKPAAGVFVGQATPWSPSTHGEVLADVIAVPTLRSETDFAAWKGKLKDKAILYGKPSTEDDWDKLPEMRHDDVASLAGYAQYPLNGDMSAQNVYASNQLPLFRKFFEKAAFQERVARFFSNEGAVAVFVPGGSGGVLHDDTSLAMGWMVFRPDRRQSIPGAVLADEAWNRMYRLLYANVRVVLRVNIATQFGEEHAKGYNTIAEITGTDPLLKQEVVMVGAHLDTWIAGTGATDNGAGVVVAMEAMRILNQLRVRPRRTIRIALWTGEEQGVLGSTLYVEEHFATFHSLNRLGDEDMPEFLKPKVATATLKSEGAKLDAYFNMDNGTGKLLGIYTEGNVAAAAIFSQWMKPIEDLGMTTISQRNSGSTDHVPFQLAGLPGFQFIQDPRDYEGRTHHTNLDTYEHLSEPDLKQAAVIEAIFLYNAAMRAQMLPRPGLPLQGEDLPLKNLYPDPVH